VGFGERGRDDLMGVKVDPGQLVPGSSLTSTGVRCAEDELTEW
jgi:hypothetical protein